MDSELNAPVVIIGAGPAGMISAAYLLQNGIKPLIIEKFEFPRVVVGESLLPRSMEHFEITDLIEPIKKANFEVKPGARFYKGGKVFYLNFSEQYTTGWRWTWQVPRAEFDNILANEVIKRGGDIYFNAAITIIDFSSQKPTIEFTHKGTSLKVTTDFIIDSSGFGSVIPKLLGQPIHKKELPKYAIFTHVRDNKKDKFDKPQLISFDILDIDKWFWVIPFSNGITSIGFVGDKRHFAQSPSDNFAYFKSLLSQSEIFSDRFRDAEILFEPIWHKRYSQSVDTLFGKNYVLTGNCLEFLDPVFSSGVAFATESGLMAAQLLVKKFNGEKVNWETEYVQHMKKGIDVFRSYVESWYQGDLQDVFFAEHITQGIKDQICSVLAGYVWDEKNPFVKKHKTAIQTLAKVIRLSHTT